MVRTSALTSVLIALTRLSLLAVILAGSANFGGFGYDVEALVVLLVAEVILVFQKRISAIRVGPVEIDLGEGDVEVEVAPESPSGATDGGDGGDKGE